MPPNELEWIQLQFRVQDRNFQTNLPLSAMLNDFKFMIPNLSWSLLRQTLAQLRRQVVVITPSPHKKSLDSSHGYFVGHSPPKKSSSDTINFYTRKQMEDGEAAGRDIRQNCIGQNYPPTKTSIFLPNSSDNIGFSIFEVQLCHILTWLAIYYDWCHLFQFL